MHAAGAMHGRVESHASPSFRGATHTGEPATHALDAMHKGDGADVVQSSPALAATTAAHFDVASQ
jgi:hypothetical protein